MTRFANLFYLTNLRTESPQEVVFTANRRCHQENVIEQLKNGVQAMRMPSDSLNSNWAYLAIAAQAWNLKAWLGLMQPDRTLGQRIQRMEFRRFLRKFVQIPCQILQTGWTSSVPPFECQRLDRSAADNRALVQTNPLRVRRSANARKTGENRSHWGEVCLETPILGSKPAQPPIP